MPKSSLEAREVWKREKVKEKAGQGRPKQLCSVVDRAALFKS
jgi:hypothetical protein